MSSMNNIRLNGGDLEVDDFSLVAGCMFTEVAVRTKAKNVIFDAVIFERCDLRLVPGAAIRNSTLYHCQLPADPLGPGNHISQATAA